MTITITSNAGGVAESLERKASEITGALTAKLDALVVALQRHIIVDKLQGQVLRQYGGGGGSLADSIRAINATRQGSSITASICVEGSAEKYAALQEFGTSSTYSIEPKAAKVLHFLVGGKNIFTKKILHPPLREHSFLRSSLEDRKEEILSGLNDALRQVLEAE